MRPLNNMYSVKGSDLMTSYEELLAEYDDRIEIKERHMLNAGLYCDGHIWINKEMTERQKACILAEEIGHHETSAGDITLCADLNSEKQERTARVWGYKKILPPEKILKAFSEGYVQASEIADYLDVDEEFLLEAIEYYRHTNDL